jgi:hypothetical protein
LTKNHRDESKDSENRDQRSNRHRQGAPLSGILRRECPDVLAVFNRVFGLARLKTMQE